MQIKTFRARTIRDALERVRDEFGPQAAVLHTRPAPAGPLARLFGGVGVEVAAAPQAPGWLADRLPAPTPAPVGNPTMVGGKLYGRLLEADVAPGLAADLTREAGGADAPLDAAIDSLAERLAVAGPIALKHGERRVVALVGPTGVGKTTTLAKLAATLSLRDGWRVGLLTVDTYRAAAVDQLEAYAQVVGLPLEVAGEPAETPAALERLGDVDLVLIDTAGRSPSDTRQLDRLRRFLEAASPDETHLVLSVGATPRALTASVLRFAVASPDALVLTKLDESPSLGHAAAVVANQTLPISYLTDGQSVPEDFRVAERRSLAAALLGAGL